MAGSLPSGTFSSPNAGVLKIRLKAQFYASSYSDAGFPSSGNASGSNLAIRAYAGVSGSYNYSPVLEKYAGNVSFEVSYPGGSVSWDVGVEEVAHKSPTGLYTYGFQDIQLDAELTKR